jgi:hypothetical protein
MILSRYSACSKKIQRVGHVVNRLGNSIQTRFSYAPLLCFAYVFTFNARCNQLIVQSMKKLGLKFEDDWPVALSTPSPSDEKSNRASQ